MKEKISLENYKQEEKYEYSVLPEQEEGESAEGYVERLVDIERGFGKKKSYVKEEYTFKHELKLFLSVEKKMPDREMGVLLGIKQASVASWRLQNNINIVYRGRPASADYHRTDEERALVARFERRAVAISQGQKKSNDFRFSNVREEGLGNGKKVEEKN